MSRRSRVEKSKRRFFGHIVYPKIQLKFSLINSLVFFLVLSANSWLSFRMTQKITKAVHNVSAVDLPRHIESLYNNYFILQIALMLLSTFFIFLITNLILHRFVGPIIPLIRYFEDLRMKGEGKLYQRSEDCLTPLHDYLKSIDLKVTKKNQAGMTLVEVLSLTFGQGTDDLYIARKKWGENKCSASDRCEADYARVYP